MTLPTRASNHACSRWTLGHTDHGISSITSTHGMTREYHEQGRAYKLGYSRDPRFPEHRARGCLLTRVSASRARIADRKERYPRHGLQGIPSPVKHFLMHDRMAMSIGLIVSASRHILETTTGTIETRVSRAHDTRDISVKRIPFSNPSFRIIQTFIHDPSMCLGRYAWFLHDQV